MQLTATIFAFGLFDWVPTIEVNDRQVNILRVIAALVTIFIGGGLLGAILQRWNFFLGNDTGTVEMLGVVHELLEKESAGKKYMITADVLGHPLDVQEIAGQHNRRLASIIRAAIGKTTDEDPYVRFASDRVRRWIIGKLDGKLDGNDWKANADRMRMRPVVRDRFACCLLGARDPVDSVKSGVVLVFDEKNAELYAQDTFPDECKVADPWLGHVPHLLHLAAKAWLERRARTDITTWTVTMTTHI